MRAELANLFSEVREMPYHKREKHIRDYFETTIWSSLKEEWDTMTEKERNLLIRIMKGKQ